MGRIRTIKPEFFSDEELSALEAETHLFAAGLLCYSDDEGYFNANPGLVKAAITPLREPSVSIHGMLTRLAEIGFVRLGESSDGKRWGQVVKFALHQRVNRPTPSKIKDLAINWIDSVKTHTQLTEDSLPEGKGKEGKGREGEARDRASTPAPSPGSNGEFLAATSLLQDSEIPSTSSDIRIIAQLIQFEAKHHHGTEGAMKFLSHQIREARSRGEPVTVFWLKDRKYLAAGKKDIYQQFLESDA